MTADLLDPASCACFNIRKAARKVTQSYDRALLPAGLLATQFTLLAVLAGERGGIPMTRLAKRLGMDRTTLTRNLRVVERAKWVSVRAGEDPRERLVTLTTAGRKTFAQALPLWKDAQQRTAKRLGRANLNQLLDLTARLGAP
jgi:DNA-binding MarR family transcriptional regulator